MQVLDNYQNPVSSGEQVRVLLEGFVLKDKIGYQRSVSSFCFCTLLKVLYKSIRAAKIELRFATGTRLNSFLGLVHYLFTDHWMYVTTLLTAISF